MAQSKKIGWVSVLFALMLFVHSGIVAASDSTAVSFPGDGYVGVCLHAEIPENLKQMLFAITGQTEITHCWITVTEDGVQGVIHSDGINGVHFLSWPDLLNLCEQDSIRLFKPNKTAIGFAELGALGINLSGFPPFFRNLLAWHLGHFMIDTWIQEMLAYCGVPYDLNFMPTDDEIYCSELMAHGWNNTGAAYELFPAQKAGTLEGWSTVEPWLEYFGLTITEDTDVYNLTYILSDEIRPYFKEISVY
ncbi:MAG: hypothetical protein MI799_16175 [Desulfobacterales bacterium]|nr:hypothetical protein [Desulfobacterales bacterium]